MKRFWDKVARRGVSECWPWTAVMTQGYGQFRFNGRMVYAHRMALMLSGVDVPDDRDVLHNCDTPACCNPAHLRIGTNAENVADRVARGRGNRPIGVKHPLAQVDDEDVREIRRRRATGELGTSVAAAFGVHPQVVYDICNYKTWKHVV